MSTPLRATRARHAGRPRPNDGVSVLWEDVFCQGRLVSEQSSPCKRGLAGFSRGAIPPSASRGPLPSLGFGLGPLPSKSFRDLNLKPGVVHKFTDWALGFIGISLRTPVCLSSFVLKSLVPSARTAYKRVDARDIWPVPPPRWSWSGPSNPGARRRRRKTLYFAASCILAVVISTLNWLLLGYPKEPPAEARAGAPITAEQSSVQDRLLRYIVRFLRASDFDADSLGRCSEKFDRVVIQELPTSGSDVDLESLLHDLHCSLNPYGRPRAKPLSTPSRLCKTFAPSIAPNSQPPGRWTKNGNMLNLADADQ